MGIENVQMQFFDLTIESAKQVLMPMMGVVFVAAIVSRVLVYWTVMREYWFAKEFEKRVDRWMESAVDRSHISFYDTVKRLLEKTYYELFEVRSILRRRRPDAVMVVADRVFLIQPGVAFLVRDTLKQIKNLKWTHDDNPRLKEVSKIVFERNPCFSRVFGLIPAATFNDVLNVLPGLFIICGIFGTFIGIMHGLPKLGGMDLNNMEGSKEVMDTFLIQISYSMLTSVWGIMCSVILKVINTSLSPETLFVTTVDRYESSLNLLWHVSASNQVNLQTTFDEHRDSIEVLAKEALERQLSKLSQEEKPNRRGRREDQPSVVPPPIENKAS